MNKPKFPTIKELSALIRDIKGDICDSYRESPEDLPTISITVGCSPLANEWAYQTGDNSYTGGAYFHRHWGVASIYRRSDSRELARDIINQIQDSFHSSLEGENL